ncbi:MAG: Spy/CpxP family protein refolding chaperone [Candidatus Acidiferrales bacterium]
MKKTAIALALACILTVPAVFAQSTGSTTTESNGSGRTANMVQHRVNYLTTVLSLNSEQQTKITNILTTAMANKSTTHTSMKTAHSSLKTAIQSNDAAGMEQAANAIGSLVAQETLAHAKTEAAIYQVLTPEQQTKLTQLQSEEHHGHGFGR